MSSTPTPNQLLPNLLSVCALNPFPGNDSSSRVQMLSSHLGQKLVVAGATERYIQTGMESEFGKYTLNIKMPCDGKILRVIERHKRTLGEDSINMNPQTIVVYENEATKEIGILNLAQFCSFHQYMGFAYKPQPASTMLTPGTFVPKDTVFYDSPGVTENGGYMFGVESNMALMSHPAASEDGILISRDFLSKFNFKTYETRVVEWGSKTFPLNMYGTLDNFKALPDIGEYIREDGILAVLRDHSKGLAAVEQSVHDLMKPDHIFDHAVYVSGPGGRVVDIRVHHEENGNSPTPAGMEKQMEKYDRARRVFYQEIIDEWGKLRRLRGDALVLSEDFHRLIVEALAAMDNSPTQKISKVYRRAPLDDYRVELVIEYDVTPTVGFKLTGAHGDKGVICKIAEPHEMPVDEAGNRADIVMDPNSTISRMNLGRLYEQYINAASRDVAKQLRSWLGVRQGDRNISAKLMNLQSDNPAEFDRLYMYLMGYYEICSPRMHKKMISVSDQRKYDHLLSILRTHIYLYMPTDNDPEMIDMVEKLQKHYRPTYGPVTYVGNSGNTVKTFENVRIASVYVMLLEKIGDAWSAVSSGKLQAFGILSQLTKADKNSQPTRNQAVKAVGETEGRILSSYAGPRFVAEVMDRNNNPYTHKSMCWGLLDAADPSNIPNLVNRNEIPYGGAKPIQLVNHVAQCGGWQYKYVSRPKLWNINLQAITK